MEGFDATYCYAEEGTETMIEERDYFDGDGYETFEEAWDDASSYADDFGGWAEDNFDPDGRDAGYHYADANYSRGDY